MILKMEKLSAFGLLDDKEAVVRALMREKCVQITSPETMEGFEEIRELTRSCAGDLYVTEQKLSRYSTALTNMSLYTEKVGMFTKKPRVAYERLGDGELLAQADALCEEIERIIAKISDLRGAKNKDQFLMASLKPWELAEVPLELSQTHTTMVTRYLLPARIEEAELQKRLEETAPFSHLEVVGMDREQRYVLSVCHTSCEDALWEVLKEFGATRASFGSLTGTPAENISACQSRIAEVDAQITALEDSLRKLGKDVYPLRYAYDVLSVELQRDTLDTDMLATRDTFCFTAWVPEVAKEAAVKVLDEYDCYYEFRDCEPDEEAPVLLQNNSWATPYESVTEMYSLPAYHGFDPNNFVSVFYFIFFGMMLSDAGIGLLLFLGGLWLYKKMDKPASEKKLIKVIYMGGFSAMIWGMIYGSFFGDIIPVVSETFFGHRVEIPMLIDPLGDAVAVMGIALAMGFVHILVGMGIKAYILVQRGQTKDAIFDVGFWFVTLIGLVMMLCSAIFAFLPDMLFTVGAAMAIAGAVGLVLTQGREKKNPLLRLFSGITSLYDVTGYLSDVLSYSRILALGLATGVIAQVVNIMGTLAGGGFVGILVFIPIFVVGTALNLGINTLGAYVHTARLQYVEFLGKFYEAGGRPFTPVRAKTKYIVVTNEEEN